MRTLLSYLFIFFVGVLVYSLTLHGDNHITSSSNINTVSTAVGSPFESSHERAPYATLLSLVENRSYALSRNLANFSSPDVGNYQGHYYSFFPLGIVFAMMPFYFLGQYFHLPIVFSYFTSAFFGILSMMLLFTICDRIFKMPGWISLFCAFVFGFASTFWSYAVTIYQHSMTSFFLLLAFYSVWKYKERKAFSWIFGLLFGISYGFSVWIDYPNALLFFPVVIYFILSAAYYRVRRKRIKITFSQSFFISFLLVAWFVVSLLFVNKQYFGGWTNTSNRLVRYTFQKVNNVDKIIADTPKSTVFKEVRIVNGLYILTVSSERGIFFYSPIFLLSILGIAKVRKKMTMEHVILLGIVLVNIFLYASFDDPWGGWSYGPRYLIPSFASLAIFVGVFLIKTQRKILFSLVAFFLAVLSAGIALLGAVTSNLVPPKGEAQTLHMAGYNFLLNISYFEKGIISSYVYKTYFIHLFPGIIFYLFVYSIIVWIFFVIISVLPFFEPKWYETKFGF